MVQREAKQTTVAIGLTLMMLGTAFVTACGPADKAAVSNATATTTGESTGSNAASPTGGTASTPNAKQRVVLLGTSLTAGLGLDPERAYPALLQRKVDSAGFPLTLVNAGLSGETSAGALRRAAWVLDAKAAAVILEVGANDGLRGVDPDSTLANIVALIQIIQRSQPTARILLVQMEAPTNLGRSYTTQFHTLYEKAAKTTGVVLLPFLLDGVAGDPRLNQADGIHPNVEGSKLVANTMWKSLEPVFSSLASSPATP